MSILSNLLEKKITFGQAAAEAAAWAESLISHDTTLAAAGAVLSDVKQEMADSALAAYIGAATKTVERALETALRRARPSPSTR